MNKPVRLMLVLAMILPGFGLPYGVSPAAAEVSPPFLDENPPPPQAPQAENSLYLPLAISASSFVVRGQVTNSAGQPVAGVTVAGDSGQAATTNASGEYALAVDSGQASLAPSKVGFMFSPSVIELDVSTDVGGQDFIAITDTTELVQNGSFESTAWWTTPTSGVPAVYSNAYAHTGSRAMRTGITNTAQNALAESRVRSPSLTIPNNATSADLRLWLFPITGESPLTGVENSAVLEEQAAPEDPTPEETAFGDATLQYDAQYVRVLDASNNSVLGTLLYVRSGNAYWSLHQFDLLAFKGRAIRLEIGAYNDGTDGVTALYVDDVSLAVSANNPEPPPPPETDACANQVANSGFEYNGSWHLPYTPYPAGYTYDAAYSGVRSMRTGIPFYTATNVVSYSDAWQTVYIPSGATNVRLKMRIYPRAEGLAQSAPEEQSTPEEEALTESGPLPEDAPKEGIVWSDEALAPEAPDAQYVLLLNPTTGVIMRTLEWWAPRNSGGWLYREYDLSAFAGRYVRIQFGTYNNGGGGRALMYVDDVRVTVCSTPPPPPPVCSQRVVNGAFENNSGWYIPYTAFSAGYSTWLHNSGVRSMRTGIVYSYHNRYSYSDFRQTISIPAGMSSARLNFHAFSLSGEAFAGAPPASDPQIAPQVTSEEAAQLAAASLAAERPTGAEQGAEAMSGDVQYLLVLDRYGNWIDTLMWRRSNEGYWRYFAFNLDRYIGSTIMLQWGTYNNGYSGVTSMYVDDVSLLACP